ncbi:MAG: zf-HC2 domain-containing protein [Ruminiclostridium sp.]|nr:zf-HC2 domain-containing protein [Ruminiclostridium sp.]
MHVREKDISLYLDNMLTSKKQKKIKLHFLVCSTCSEKLNEYKKLYKTMELLEFDFQLDCLESEVMKKIKEQKAQETQGAVKPVPVKYYSPGLVYALILFVIAGLFFTPVTNTAERIAQNTTALMLNKWLDWINKVKWQVVDIISSISSNNFVMLFLPVFFGVVLISGGAYLFISGKKVKKA